MFSDEIHLYEEGYEKSLYLLEKAATEQGILAAISDKDNYKRVWTRDGIVSGLAGLLSNSEKIIDSLKITLNLLASHQAPRGQIPSNIKFNDSGKVETVSYGGPVGRVDTLPWFIIGVTSVAKLTGDVGFAEEKLPYLNRCLFLLDSWDFNKRGLIYVPQSGDWADEQIFHGYILSDQLLRFWALRNYANIFGSKEVKEKSEKIKETIIDNFFPTKEKEGSLLIYNKKVIQNLLNREGKDNFAPYSITPSGYYKQFDFLSHSLSILLDVPDKEKTSKIIKYGERVRKESAVNMVPNLFPPITDDDPEWHTLQNNYSVKFRNRPFEYQNGGCWPIINGWWGISLIHSGFVEGGKDLLGKVNKFNKSDKVNDWTFYEFGNYQTGKKGGAKYFSWSAAGALLIYNYLNGKKLFIG